MKNEKIKVETVSREVIEKKLLTSLDDGAHVAIVLGKEELDTLIQALEIADDETTGYQFRRQSNDLVRLRKEAFGA